MSLRMIRRGFLTTASALALTPLLSWPRGGHAAGSNAAKIYLPTASGESKGVKFADTPSWARDNPAWYVPETSSAGSCLLTWGLVPQHATRSLKSFLNLPKLHEQAQALGTSAIYLVNWYKGGWSNWGDYVPRMDLGGESALKTGIEALHQAGGRIILYVEGFVVNAATEVGIQHGAEWALVLSGKPQPSHPKSWSLCPASGWADYFEGVAKRIAGYGADGIFVDSYGYQRDWQCMAGKRHHHPNGEKSVFNDGTAHVMQRARAAMQEINRDAIIITEGPLLKQLFQYTDGSLDWGIHSLVTRWLWDAQGKTDTITTSWTIDEWHQILAIGGKLACPSNFLLTPPEGSAKGVIAKYSDPSLLSSTPAAKMRLLGEAAFRALQAWRNAGIIMGLRMPDLWEFCPREPAPGQTDPFAALVANRTSLANALESVRPKAQAIDEAFAGKRAVAPVDYVKKLNGARGALAKFIDHGSSVVRVLTNCDTTVAWRFTSDAGEALTAANVADDRCRITFDDASGPWRDTVSGDSFTTPANRRLTIEVLPHSVRLLTMENSPKHR